MTPEVVSATTLARFDRERLAPVTLFQNEHVRVLVAGLEPGQEIPLHAPAVDLVVVVAEGDGELYAGGRVRPLHPGDVAVVPAGQMRGIRARSSRLVVVNTVTPPPGERDHAPAGPGAVWPPPA